MFDLINKGFLISKDETILQKKPNNYEYIN